MYIIRCREDNTVLDTFSTYDEALKALNEYEDIDRKNGCMVMMR